MGSTRDWVSDVEFLQGHIRSAASLSLSVRVYNLQAVVGIVIRCDAVDDHRKDVTLSLEIKSRAVAWVAPNMLSCGTVISYRLVTSAAR